MVKGPGLYTDIGKKARDLLYKDYNNDKTFSITAYSPPGVTINSSVTRSGRTSMGEVTFQAKQNNITTDFEVCTNYTFKLFVTATVDEALKSIFSIRLPNKNSGKIELQYYHDYAGISTSIWFDKNPVVYFSGMFGTNVFALGTDVSFDTKLGDFTKIDAGLNFTKDNLNASLVMDYKWGLVAASFCHIVNPLFNSVIGAEVSHIFSNKDTIVTVGSHHSLDPFTSVKTRVDSTCFANALIQHEWRPNTFFTFSGEVNLMAIEKSAKVGLALALKP